METRKQGSALLRTVMIAMVLAVGGLGLTACDQNAGHDGGDAGGPGQSMGGDTGNTMGGGAGGAAGGADSGTAGQ